MSTSLRRSQRGIADTTIRLIIVGVIAILYLLSMPIAGSMIDDSKAERALTQLGFTNVTILDKDVWFVGMKGCGSGDGALYRLRGTNAANQIEVVMVCAGVLKGGTLRS